MVRRAKQLKYRPLLAASTVLLPVACLLFGGWLVVAGVAQVTSSPWWGWAAVIVGLLPFGAAAAGTVFFILRFLLPWFYDPNAADVEGRIALGRSRAVSKAFYESGAG